MSKPGYIIVRGTIDSLPGYVNDAIQNGYRPVGGPFLIQHGAFMVDELFGQAMALEGCRP